MIGLEIGRILHMLGVVFWIGGVAFVTTIILPTIKKFKSAEEAIEFFEKVEHRFAIQVKIASLITGLSGFYMISKLKIWDWFLDPSYWWMWAMATVWLIFTLMLFVIEPLVLKKRWREKAKTDPEGVFKQMQKMHLHLLWLSLLTIISAVAGSHGWLFF
ncbi:MAG: hypothetical protein DRQ13_11405 [Ignavibacteriae bacterium]|nr:MAG: hypothetical protein DRQ13_11405 [Ignavibacteriota bacterium]